MTDIRLATTMPEISHAYAVRHEVFVVEQGVPRHLELDELDDTADHFVAYDDEGLPVGAGRLVVEPAGFEGAPSSASPVGHLGRLAVLKVARGTGLGIALVAAIEERAAARGLRVVVLSAQTQAIGFYERIGYAAHGPEFDDAGLPHRWMTRAL
ncbi:MAG: GNAT family N-acetyltransferase [Actinomycetes bacterium]